MALSAHSVVGKGLLRLCARSLRWNLNDGKSVTGFRKEKYHVCKLDDGFCLGLGIASTLVGGVFLAFSDFVMRGLGAAETSAGVDAMQQINRVVYRSVFLTTFVALVPASIGFAAYGWWSEAGVEAL